MNFHEEKIVDRDTLPNQGCHTPGLQNIKRFLFTHNHSIGRKRLMILQQCKGLIKQGDPQHQKMMATSYGQQNLS